MATEPTYTIAQAARLTGLHRNTIRQKVRSGQLRAETRLGKFGEEYRIPRSALVAAGLLADGEAACEPVEAVSVTERVEASSPPPGANPEGAFDGGAAALRELLHRHEQAIYRLGYLQGELDRTRLLAERAESLQEQAARHAAELDRLREELAEARARAEEAARLREELAALRARLAEAAQRRPWWRRWRRPGPQDATPA